jgi:hypothetical protein
MRSLFRNLWSKKSPKPFRSARPEFESLESREVPTVTYHGGALLPNVEVQAVYFGSQWTGSAMRNQLDSFLQYVVQSPYMLMLSNAGYRTGNGSFSGDLPYQAALSSGQYLTDGAIQSFLQSYISQRLLQQPDSNRLYIVFVEPGVVVDARAVPGVGSTSNQGVLGYHFAFGGTDANGHGADIHYAVIPYPGCDGDCHCNSSFSWLPDLDGITLAASHELAEAMTDANANYKDAGWYDDSLNGEVGDLANRQTVYLGGYAVQRIADKNDQPMTPFSAGPRRPVQFVLQNDGWLYEYTAISQTAVADYVTSVSDQGIDNYGRAVVDYVTTSGDVFEYHDIGGSTDAGGVGGNVDLHVSGAVQAKAGQGVSYALFNDGSVREYRDASGTWSNVWSGSIQSIDAGTDRWGVNAVDVLFSGGDAWMHSDTDGWHFLMHNVSQLSGGQEGLVALLDQSGNAFWLDESVGTPNMFAVDVRQVTTGYDAWGHWMVGVVHNDASAWLFCPSTNSGSFLTGGVWQMSKDNLGVVSVLFGGTDASYFDLSGQHRLTVGGTVAVA